MKFKYYLFLARKNFFNNKINIINVFLMIISMEFAILALSFSKTSTNLLNNQIDNNINSHALIINNVIQEDKISSISNIDYIMNYSGYRHNVKTKNNEEIILIGVPKNHIKVIKGVSLSSSELETAMICPNLFYFGPDAEKYDEEYLKHLKKGTEMINKNIILSSVNYKEEYKIIGVYDVNKYTYGEYNICFTNYDNIIDIYNKEIESIKEECKQENRICNNLDNSSKYTLVMVKDAKKIEETQKEISKLGYSSSSLINIDRKVFNLITTVFLIFSIIIMIIVFIILLISSNKFIQYNKKNSLIYKSIGYNDSILIKVGYLEAIILSIVSLIGCIFITIIMYQLAKKIFIVDINTGCPIYISYFAIIASFIYSLMISILSKYLSIKNNHNSIIEGFADAEI